MNGPLGSVYVVNAGNLMPGQPAPVFSSTGQVQGFCVVPQNLSRLTPMADGAMISRLTTDTPVSLLPNAGSDRPRLLPRLLSIPASMSNKYIAPAQTATKQQLNEGSTASDNVTSPPKTTSHAAPTALPDTASRLAQPDELNAQPLSGQTSNPDTIDVDRPAPGNVTQISVYEQELKQLVDQTKKQVNSLVANATDSLKAIKTSATAPLEAIDEAKQSLKATINEERQKINITYQALEEINKQLIPIALSTTALNQDLMQKLGTHMHTLAEEYHSHLVHLLERRPPSLRECVSPTLQDADTAEAASELTLSLFNRQLGTFQSDMQHLLRLNTAIDQWLGIKNPGKLGSIRMMLQHGADILDGNTARNSSLTQATASRSGSRKRKRIYRKKPAADTTSNHQTLKQLTQALTAKGSAQTPAPRSLYELIAATADAIEALNLPTQKRVKQPETQQPSCSHDHNYCPVGEQPDHD